MQQNITWNDLTKIYAAKYYLKDLAKIHYFCYQVSNI